MNLWHRFWRVTLICRYRNRILLRLTQRFMRGSQIKAWLTDSGKVLEHAKEHVFYRGLKGKELLWDRLQGSLEAIDETRITMYNDAIP